MFQYILKESSTDTENPNASLYFYDAKTFEGLMLTGKAEVSYDDEKRKEFWNDGMKKYYPLGYTDPGCMASSELVRYQPDFALIRFTASKGSYYHGWAILYRYYQVFFRKANSCIFAFFYIFIL